MPHFLCLSVCHWANNACHAAIKHMSLTTCPPCFALQASSESASSVSARQLPEQQQWDSSHATSGFVRASPFAAWSPAQPELPLPPGDTANQKPPWQSVSRSPSGPRKASSTIPAGRLMSTSASILNTADSLTTGRMLPTRRDREGQFYESFQRMPSLCLHYIASIVDMHYVQI